MERKQGETWTARVMPPPDGSPDGFDYEVHLIVGGELFSIVKAMRAAEAEALAAQINSVCEHVVADGPAAAPAPSGGTGGGPGDGLPGDIEQAPDGYLWLHSEDRCPDGYEVRGLDGDWTKAAVWNTRFDYPASESISWVKFPVRPVPAAPEPVPEMVPWHEAVQQALTVVLPDGDTFTATTAFFDSSERFCVGTDAHDADANVPVDPSGRVAVLPEGGE